MEDTALHPFGSATLMVIRATRSGSRCSACGRFGHERGDPECVHALDARGLPVPTYSPDVHDDEEQASESDRQAIRQEIERYVGPPTIDPVMPDDGDTPIAELEEEQC